MSWPDKIELLRNYVVWECRDIPPDVVLAIIQHESGGQPGIPARVKCKCGMLPTVDGGERKVCRALGLMQTIPATINWYNQSAKTDDDRATYEDMTGEDERAIRLQIRVGCKFLALCNRYLNRLYPEACPAESLSAAKPDQISIVLTAYAVGHGNTGKKIKGLIADGIKPNFKNLQKHYPDWGKNKAGVQINNPLRYAVVVGTRARENWSESYASTIPSKLVSRIAGKMTPTKAMILVGILVAGAGYAIQRHFTGGVL